MKMLLTELSFAKWRPFCPGGDEFTLLKLRSAYSAQPRGLNEIRFLFCLFGQMIT